MPINSYNQEDKKNILPKILPTNFIIYNPLQGLYIPRNVLIPITQTPYNLFLAFTTSTIIAIIDEARLFIAIKANIEDIDKTNPYSQIIIKQRRLATIVYSVLGLIPPQLDNKESNKDNKDNKNNKENKGEDDNLVLDEIPLKAPKPIKATSSTLKLVPSIEGKKPAYRSIYNTSTSSNTGLPTTYGYSSKAPLKPRLRKKAKTKTIEAYNDGTNELITPQDKRDSRKRPI